MHLQYYLTLERVGKKIQFQMYLEAKMQFGEIFPGPQSGLDCNITDVSLVPSLFSFRYATTCMAQNLSCHSRNEIVKLPGRLAQLVTSWQVDRPTQLICISDIYLSTDKYKRHSRAIC